MRPGRYTPLRFILLFLALVPLAPAGGQAPADEAEVILLRADPEVIPADGQSSATITAEVRNRQGALVADGTTVRFTTTAGTISPTMTTRAGIVRALLRSEATEGIAEVTATAGTRAIARVQVTFTAEELLGREAKPYVRIQAECLQFVPEKGLIDAAGNVRLTYRALAIAADTLQLDVTTLAVKARNGVRVKGTRAEVTADLLALEMQAMRGSLVAVEQTGHIRRQILTGYQPEVLDAPERAPDGTFDFEDVDDSKALMTARKITLFPGEKLQFSGFGLHVAGARVLRFPFYVLSLNPYGPDADQFLSLDSVGGVSVNLPFYYSVTDNTNGSIRLRRQSRYSFDGYSTRPGWHLALDQRYHFGQNNHGQVELNHITSSDWGLRWRHEQQFGQRTHTYLTLDSPAHRDLYARGEVYHSFPVGDLSLSTYSNLMPHVAPSIQSRLYFRMRPGRIKGPNIQYYWTANLGWSTWGGVSQMEEGIDLQIHPPSLRLGQRTSMQFYLGSGFTASNDGSGPTAQASASLVRRIGQRSNATLRYSYYYSGRSSEFFGPSSGQSLTGQLYLTGGERWGSSLIATLLPDSGDVSVYGYLMYSPLRNWRLELRPTFSRYGSTLTGVYPASTTNLDIYLVRRLGGRDVALRWSTLDKRIRLELAATSLRF